MRHHLGGWLAIVILVGEDMRWDKQTAPNAPPDDAKEWAIKKALIEAHGSKYEEVSLWRLL